LKPNEILAHLAEIGTPPDSDSAFKISVGLDQTIKRLRTETFPFLAAGGSELQFVYAPYGRGKSHFLRTIEKVASNDDLVAAYIDCSTGKSPFRDIRETYNMIANALTVTLKDDPLSSVSGVTKIIEESLLDLNQDEARSLLERVQTDSHLAPDFRNLVYAYGMSVLKGDVGQTLSESLEALLTASSTYRVTLGNLYRAHPELPRPIGKLSRRNAGLWLRSLLTLPQSLGHKGTVILFDETERVHSFYKLRSRKQQTHFANLRNFVDYMAVGTFRGCSIYYAVVEDFIELAREQLDALSQRIERIHLGTGDSYRNPRAVWVSLDELTVPNPESPIFYEKLAVRIVGLGKNAGLPQTRVNPLIRTLSEKAQEYADIIYDGAVREFIKDAASSVAMEVKRNA
jgi:hypothetical protein